MDPSEGLPVELHQRCGSPGIDQAKRVDSEALHGSKGPRDAAVAHVPQNVMGGLGVQGHEVPEGVMGGLGLRNFDIGMRLGCVNDVGELDAVLDEEHRNVVSDEVECALRSVELHREAPGVADGVSRASRPEHGREPSKYRGECAALSEELGLRDRPGRPVRLKDP
jgi:hypothetical protein